jgi:hypothetical protein
VSKKAYAEHGKIFANNDYCPEVEKRWMAESVVVKRSRHEFEISLARFKAAMEYLPKGFFRGVDDEIHEALVDLELAKLGDVVSPKSFLKLMEVEQRLDAAMDRAVRRLLQLKAMKPMVGLRAEPAKPAPGGVALPFPSIDSGRKGRAAAATQSSFDFKSLIHCVLTW